MKRRPASLDQFLEGATVGDAITDHALTIRGWLRSAGLRSEIYAAHVHPELARTVRTATSYRPHPRNSLVVYHHSIGSTVADQLIQMGAPLLLVYHNVTPPEFVQQADPALAAQLRAGRQQLIALRERTVLALGVSPYNVAELEETGFHPTGLLPIVLDPQQYDLPADPQVVAECAGSAPILLFVGRLVPNKRQEDLVKLLYFFRRIEPEARLVLVGAEWMPAYASWVRDLARTLGLADQVRITGHVSQPALVTYYRRASVYVSMSEHEGFGKPLIESMVCGLPVVAYAAAGVPATLGGAGVLFHDKRYDVLAELLAILLEDPALRARIVTRQAQRADAFLAPNVEVLWNRYMEQLL